MILTETATTEQKAQAWDRLMADTGGDDSAALTAAWLWLRDEVARSERPQDTAMTINLSTRKVVIGPSAIVRALRA